MSLQALRPPHCASWSPRQPSTVQVPASSISPPIPSAGPRIVVAGLTAAATVAARRRGRRALTDDVLLAFDEVLNTAEDAALHAGRLVPWLSPAPKEQQVSQGQRRIVVLGTGWAAHAMSKVVDAAAKDICIVSPRNYFLFTPMLAASAVGTVEYRSILEHIRSANPTLRFVKGSCTEVDVAKREVVVSPKKGGKAFSLEYDTLVVAVGVQPSSCGVPGVQDYCMFLKEVEDARLIRKRVTECFELAELPGTSLERQRALLTFAVVGGGPTGCEFCGELSDFVRNDLRRFYPNLFPLVHILLLHRGKTLLSSFAGDMRRVALEVLESQGIEVRTSAAVTRVDRESITLEEESIPCGLCVWAAGQGPRDIVEKLRAQIPAQQELPAGALHVDDWLRVRGVEDGSILALGDCARTEVPLPLTAQVAAQQGAYVARLLNRGYILAGEAPPCLPPDAGGLLQARAGLVNQEAAPPFRFLDLGRLAYLGESQAVAEVSLGSTSISQASGQAAFVLWRSVYLVKQVSFRNRVLVAFDWIKSRLFGRDLTRF